MSSRGIGRRDTGLSQRQLSIVRELASGKNQSQAAIALRIDNRTIGHALTTIRDKLLLDNTAKIPEIVEAARKAGYNV